MFFISCILNNFFKKGLILTFDRFFVTREKMLRLQHENRLLKEKKDAEAEVLQTDNAGLMERIAQLEAENRCGFCRAAIRNKCVKVPPSTSLTQQNHREALPQQESVSLVATMKARLASKPVFAGSLTSSPPRVPNRLNSSVSCSQLSLSSSNNASKAPVFSPINPPLISESGSSLSTTTVTTTLSSSSSTAKAVERLKGAFFAGSSCSVTPATNQSSRVFTRSASFGYDKALGFASSSSSSSSSTILDAAAAGKWANCESVGKANPRVVSKLENVGDRNNGGLRLAALRRESNPTLISKMTTVEPTSPSSSSIFLHLQQQQHKPPPPPVEAVVITRDSSPRGDETDSGYRIGYDESAPSPVNGGSHYFVEDESLLMEYTGRLHYNKTPDRTRSSLPDDAIEIDSSFHHGGSVDSESVSVSSFSIISETVASSDRSFEHSESLLLTPRSTTRTGSSMQQDDTVSRKSFGKSLKKRKMFKAAANAMFSLCGP